jgi:hypothetical protein
MLAFKARSGKPRKAPMSIGLSVPLYQREAYWTGFREICYWGFFFSEICRKKIRIWFKSVKNIWQFTQRPKYVLLSPAKQKSQNVAQ